MPNEDRDKPIRDYCRANLVALCCEYAATKGVITPDAPAPHLRELYNITRRIHKQNVLLMVPVILGDTAINRIASRAQVTE